jgi:hypothetical protein
MNDAFAVSSVERLGNLCGDHNSSIDWQRAELQSLAERLSLEELQDEERDTLVLSDIVDSTNVWVVHPRNCTSFALEPIQLGTLDTTHGGEHLNGDGPVKAGILGVVHLAHPSGSDQGDDLVRTDSTAHVQ